MFVTVTRAKSASVVSGVKGFALVYFDEWVAPLSLKMSQPFPGMSAGVSVVRPFAVMVPMPEIVPARR